MNRETVTLPDGTKLSMIMEGSGQPIILIPGWSQTANTFRHQIEAFSSSRKVIAIDMRGHGESAKAEQGYRIQCLAKDLFDIVGALGLTRPDVLGHSMGNSVIWSYLAMFGAERPLGRLVLVDQAPAVVAQPGWSDEVKDAAGCLLPDMDALAGFEAGVITSETADDTKAIIRGMFTGNVSESDLDWIASENVKLPRAHAAHLLHDHSVIDWRSTIAAITNPTLVVGAEASIFSAQSQRWIASKIPGAKVEIFSPEEKGSHFMFWENYTKFNYCVLEFINA